LTFPPSNQAHKIATFYSTHLPAILLGTVTHIFIPAYNHPPRKTGTSSVNEKEKKIKQNEKDKIAY
jgi:hypothetical protein